MYCLSPLSPFQSHIVANNLTGQLREEITACVFNMASVDFEAFFAHFVARFLEQTDGVDDAQRQVLKANLKTDTVRTSKCFGPFIYLRTIYRTIFD